MFAIIKTGGKQYRAVTGSIIKVEKLCTVEGSDVEFSGSDIIFHNIDNQNGCVVTAEVLRHQKTKKVIVFKKKRRKDYKRKNGHRQNITVLRIKKIS